MSQDTAGIGRLLTGVGTSVIWSPELLGYEHSADHPMSPKRLDLTMALAAELGVVDGVEFVDPGRASREDLLRIHTTSYVKAVEHASTLEPGGLPMPGHGLGTDDNPVFGNMHDASAAVTGGTLTAAKQIASGAVRRAVSVAGGMHHAMPGAAAGFCVYNDAAVAIAWLLENGYDRVAYIDVDVHHGDGVQKAFIDDPRVLTISLHQHPATLWPNTGWPAEVGFGRAEGTSVNIALLPGVVDRYWLRAFHAIVPSVVRDFAPQIIISQCGADSHREDPLADLSLTVDGHAAVFRAMRDLADEVCDGRWIAIGGGGYEIVRVVPRSWTHLIATALDIEVEPSTPIPDSWKALAATVAPSTPPPDTMTDGGDVDYTPWDGGAGTLTGEPSVEREIARVDSAVLDTRRAVFPLIGLDPDDPRD